MIFIFNQLRLLRHGAGVYSTEVVFFLFTQLPLVRLLAFLKIYFNVAKIYQLRCLEESGQRFENVD